MRLRIRSNFLNLTRVLLSSTALVAVFLWTAIPASAQSAVGVETTVNAATYDQLHSWSISKTGSSVSGFAGEILAGGDWVINVSETASTTNFLVSGAIVVTNLSAGDVNVTLSGTTNDGATASVKCEGGSSVTIAAGKNTECFFGVLPGSGATEFTATAVVDGGAAVTQSVPLNFVLNNVLGGTATLMDTVMGGLLINETLIAGQGPWSRTVTDPKGFHCSIFRSEYDGGFVVHRNHDNEAVLIVGDLKLPASASITYTCEARFADVLKMTNGVPNTSFAWSFAFFNGPDGFTSDYRNLIGGVQTDIDPDGNGLLPLGRALNPTRTYTICETNIPAGYFARWQLNGQLLVPYNPDSDLSPPEDLGNRCLDFGAGTNIPLSAGETIKFEIDNRYPGGDPRTPGYWKNWSRCDGGGGQARNADRQAVRSGYAAGEGWRVGFWLLDDVLNPSVGGGILWDDIQADAFQVPIASCEQAYEILDMREVTANGVVGDGKKMASDGARTLARHLLAAQLNLAAGACRTQAALDASLAGEALLDSINFDGTRSTAYLTSKSGALYAEALRLAGILDSYNNGAFCGSLAPQQ